MKKYILLIAAAGIAVTGTLSARTTIADRHTGDLKKQTDFSKHEVEGEIEVDGRIIKIGKPKGMELNFQTRAYDDKGWPIKPDTPAPTTPVITNAPGKTVQYCKDMIGYGSMMPAFGAAVVSEINWDGAYDAYFKDIVTTAMMNHYVRGFLDDETITVPMGQTVFNVDGEEYSLNLGLLKCVMSVDPDTNNPYVYYYYCDDYDKVTYQWTVDKGDEYWELICPPNISGIPEGCVNPIDYGMEPYAIGYYYTDDYEWSGYCDFKQIYQEFPYEKVEMPQGVPTTTFAYVNTQDVGVIVNVAQVDNYLYIEGLSPYVENGVFRGELVENGTKLKVEPNQYIGIEAGLYYVITSTIYLDDRGKMELAAQEPTYFLVERDAQNKITAIKADPSSPYFLIFNDDPIDFYPVDFFKDLVLTQRDDFNGIPSTPSGVFYENYADLMGANFIFFRLRPLSNTGDVIDISKLYYTIFVNGDPVEFEQTTSIDLNNEVKTIYPGIKEPTYLIPYTFANDIDLYEDSGGTFVVALYFEGMDDVGVESVYRWGKKATYSQLVTVNCTTGKISYSEGSSAGVEQIKTEEVAGVEYFDLQGRKVEHPANGLFVKVYKMIDGTSKTRKVLVK